MEFQHGNDVRKQETVGGNVLLNECCALNTTRTYGHTSTHTHIHAHAHSCWSSVGGRRLEWRKIINFLVTSKDSFNGISSRRFFLSDFFRCFSPSGSLGSLSSYPLAFILALRSYLSICLVCLPTYLSISSPSSSSSPSSPSSSSPFPLSFPSHKTSGGPVTKQN